jgi:hypothetical protein
MDARFDAISLRLGAGAVSLVRDEAVLITTTDAPCVGLGIICRCVWGGAAR